MSRKVIPFILGTLILFNMTHADELLDRCASPRGHTASEVETLWHQGVKDRRADCINALLSNADFNSRTMAQRLIVKLAPEDQSFVLQNALQMDAIWTEPKKHGEDIAGFEALAVHYIEILHENGIQAKAEQLLTKDGRTELLHLLRKRRASTGWAETSALPKSAIPSQADPTQTLSLPPIVPTMHPSAPKVAIKAVPSTLTTSEEPSSTPWSIIVVLIVAACGLLWLLLKRRS